MKKIILVLIQIVYSLLGSPSNKEGEIVESLKSDLGRRFYEKMIECNYREECVIEELEALLNDACQDYREFQEESFEDCYSKNYKLMITIYNVQDKNKKLSQLFEIKN